MRKYFLIAIPIFYLQTVFSQTDYEKIIFREIDSLKKALAGLKDNERVDCLNAISDRYGFTIVPGKVDSIFNYAMSANREGNKLGYKYGIAKSLINLAKSKQYSKQNTDRENREKYVRQALVIANDINDDQILGEAYYLLAGTMPDLNSRNENYKKAIYYFQKTKDIRKETEATTWLAMGYLDEAEYEEGFPYCKKSIILAKNNIKVNKTEWDYELVQWSLYDMAELYKYAGDYETALDYINQFNIYAKENKLIWNNYVDVELYCLLGKYDSALYFLQPQKGSDEKMTKGKIATNNKLLGYIYLHTNQIDRAIPLLIESIATFRDNSWGNTTIINPLLYAGMAYAEKKNYSSALAYTREAFNYASRLKAKRHLVDCYELFSNIYRKLGKNDSAYIYLKKYTSLKDSVLTRQFYFRLSNYKKEAEEERKTSQINLLNKDNQIKEQKLKQQATLRNGLIAGVVLLVLLGVFIFRSFYLKRKKQEAENEKKTTELEMQALRAQMNPHFIFNCLSSINRIIIKNDSHAASDYLTRFSRLIRMVLINSQRSMIPLEDELQMLRLYLDMERLRFKDSFEYKIIFTNTIDEGAVQVPPLLLQPFCENAIWHGLMQKDGQGLLTVELSMQDNILNCIITDNGIGREKAQELKSKSAESQKSMGLKITTERLALLNRDKDLHTYYEIEDLKDESGNAAGTRVVLKIGLKETVEETA